MNLKTILAWIGGFFKVINPNDLLEDLTLLSAAVATFKLTPFDVTTPATWLAMGAFGKSLLSILTNLPTSNPYFKVVVAIVGKLNDKDTVEDFALFAGAVKALALLHFNMQDPTFLMAAAAAVKSGLSLLQQLASSGPSDPVAGGASVKSLILPFLLACLLGASSVNAAPTVFTYGGGLNIGRQTLTGATPGLYSFPVIGLTGSVLSYEDNSLNVAPEVGLTGAILFGDAIASPDAATNGIDLQPTAFLFGVDAGGAFAQQSPNGGTYVTKGMLGPCVFDPKDFGNVGLAINQLLSEKWDPTVWLLFVQSFDVGGGIPVTKLR